jgi:hypothetical protein
VLGQVLVIIPLTDFFTWSVMLAAGAPLLLFLITFILVRKDKYYFFSSKKVACEAALLEPVLLGGRKGLFRFPIALTTATGSVVASALLVNASNPLVIYGSEYTVWAMMLSLFYFTFWSVMVTADSFRPSALHRGYVLFWLFTIFWVALVAVAIMTYHYKLASGYVVVFFETVVFLATITVLLEMCALPTKSAFAKGKSSIKERDLETFQHTVSVYFDLTR